MVWYDMVWLREQLLLPLLRDDDYYVCTIMETKRAGPEFFGVVCIIHMYGVPYAEYPNS